MGITVMTGINHYQLLYILFTIEMAGIYAGHFYYK